jgi:hypothetical protein
VGNAQPELAPDIPGPQQILFLADLQSPHLLSCAY